MMSIKINIKKIIIVILLIIFVINNYMAYKAGYKEGKINMQYEIDVKRDMDRQIKELEKMQNDNN